MKRSRTWILIADGGRAKVVEHLGPRSGFREMDGLAFSNDLPPSRDILADRPGRSFESVGGARHAQENTSDPHRELKRTFAGRLCRLLEAKLNEGQFDELVLVAPPSFLGDLREELAPRVRAKISAEIARDLTKVPGRSLARHLEDYLRL